MLFSMYLIKDIFELLVLQKVVEFFEVFFNMKSDILKVILFQQMATAVRPNIIIANLDVHPGEPHIFLTMC